MWQIPSATINAGGYESLLSQGRRQIFRFASRRALSHAAIALYCVWAHGHGTRMLALKARNGFTVCHVSPAFRFAKPLPTALRVKRGALAAQ
jgi:hypothetical protein